MFAEPNYPELGIEIRYINKILNEMSTIYARLINQYKFKYQTVFSAKFDNQKEDEQVLDETELYINLNINQNLAHTDLVDINVRFALEEQNQKQDLK